MIRGTTTKFNNRIAVRSINLLLTTKSNGQQHNVIRNSTSTSMSLTLPQQPVPKLEDTLQKYLYSVRPLLSAESFEKTKKLADKFIAGEGNTLQSLLLQKAQKTDSWLADWWLKAAYLGYRESVVINSNPGLYFPKQTFNNQTEWLQYTAKIIFASLKFKEKIDQNDLPLEKVGKFPLDMGQYYKIFGTCRVPSVNVDNIEYNPNSRHIVVIYRNGFYRVSVYESDSNNCLPENIILTQLKAIVDERDQQNPPIGILTMEHRDTLAPAYERLTKEKINKTSIDCIQKSLFTICLDKSVPIPAANDEMRIASHQLIHGGNSTENAANRWFDKTLQFVINENGINGITYEHSPAEGQPVANLTDFIHQYLNGKSTLTPGTSTSGFPKPEKLPFNISKKTENDIQNAIKFADRLTVNLDMNIVHFQNYGKNFVKQYKMSPDSYIQMAMQYAFYKLHNEPGAHYETAQQRMFLHGRTETIRSCSVESVEFAKAMDNSQCSDHEKLKLLKAAVDGHKKYTVQAMTGYGVDRHLLGLKLIAKEHNLPIPSLFADEAYTKSIHFRLSTSQVASQNKAFMCYGPVVEDGYGICYNPRNDDILFAVSSLKNCDKTCSTKMGNSLRMSLENMQSLLIRAGNATSKL